MKLKSLLTLVVLVAINYSTLFADPSVVISSGVANPTNAASFSITITFSEAVTGFDVGDITVGNCTLTNFSSTANPIFTVDVIPSAQGLLTINIAAGVCTATAGGASNTAAAQFSITFDSQPPTVSITSAAPNPTNTSPIAISITFSESVTGFVAGDITVTNGSAINFSGSGTNYTADITPSGQGAVSIDIAGGSAIDAAGNGNTAATTFSITYDSQSPTVAITSSETSPTNANPIPVTITFNESVTGLILGEIAVTNGSASNLSGSGANYTVDITPSGVGTVKVDIAAGVATDAAGNGNTAAPQFSINFDNQGPSVSITSIAPNPTNVSPIPLTITFSKSVTGFIVGDITVTNGTKSGFSGSGTTYTVNITPSGQGAVLVDVAADVAQDDASNGNTAATQFSRTFDSQSPTVSSVGVPANGIYTETEVMNFTVNFNETVYVNTTGGTPYITIDMNSGNNKHVSYVSGSGSNSLLFSYIVQNGDYDNDGISVDNSINLNSGTIKDAAGNSINLTLNGVGSTSGVYVDGKTPLVEYVTPPANGYYIAGQALVFVVKYDKAITVNTGGGTPYINITLNTGGTVRAYYASGSTTMNLTFSYTVVTGNLDLDGIALGTSIIKNGGSLKYGSTNADLLLSNIGNTTGVLVDAVAPVVTKKEIPAGSYGIGSTMAVTIESDGNNYTAVAPVTVNGEVSPFVNMGSNVYKVFYTVQAANVNYNNVTTLPANIVLRDPAGNTFTISSLNVQGGTLSINTKPTVRITGSTTKCDYPWQTVPITFTFTGVKPYTFTYNDGSANHTVTALNADSYTVNVVSGTYTLVSLTDQTGNSTNSALENATITINPVTTPTFAVSASPYNVTEPKDDLSKYANPLPGTFWGNGVGTDGYFYPSIIDVSGGAVTCNVKYSYTNSYGCKDTVAYDIIVKNDTVYFKDLASFYCASGTTPTSIITVDGLGTITWESFDISGTAPGVEWTDIGNHQIQIDPKLMSTGNHIISYSYTENGKTFTITDNFDIVRISNPVDFNTLKTSYCSNDPEVILIVENNYFEAVKGHFNGPISGFYSASNISATLTPTAAPKDQNFNISYYFETKEGCVSPTITKPSRVNTVPGVSFTLRDNYNFSEIPITLSGAPSGGNFYGEIIELNKTLKPSLVSQAHLEQNIDITYSYTDGSTGCVGNSTLQTKVYKADAPIVNLNPVYCFDDLTFSISCNPSIGSDFVFSSKKNAVTQINDHDATYSLLTAGEGVDTVWYRYKINTTPYEIAQVVFVDSIGNISLDINGDFCNDDDPLIIVGQHREMNGTNEYSYTGTPAAFQRNPIYATFSPKFETPGNYSLKYKFTSDKGCYKEVTKNLNLNPVSNVNFEVIGNCPNINEGVQFLNKSTEPAGAIITWEWNFEGNKIYDKNPTYPFTSTGLKTVTLRAVTDKGCDTDNFTNITVGYSANADFKWDRECFTVDSIQFTDNSSGGTVVSSLWKYNEDSISNNRNIKYKFPGVGTYNLELIIKTAEGCRDSITKQISIQKFVDFTSSSYYLDDFDQGVQDWVAKGISSSDYSSWTFGLPTGTYFNSAASGTTSWFTNTGLASQIKESSQVLSPCFDLRGLQKPMVKLNIWSAPERGRDGAVLQYSVDGGKTWLSTNIVGAENEGVNWYDPVNISSKPAGQSAGWSSSTPQAGWKSARHNLEMLKDSSNVRFRIVYANEANNISPFNGFAFDDFLIGERNQMVLNEVFTNVDVQCNSANLLLKQYEKDLNADIIPIHYHTSYPSNDPFYSYYAAGPMARGFFYGTSSVPYVLSNGLDPSALGSDSAIKEYQRKVDQKTLLDPAISFTEIIGSLGGINVKLIANKDISGDNIVLSCALVKDSIPTTDGKYYYNVLRKFYPNTSGILISTNNWSAGQIKEQTINIGFDNSAEIADAKLVLFVQNVNSNLVYQAATYSDLQKILSVTPVDISSRVDIYPNPAYEFVVVESLSAINQLMVFDITGRLVSSFAPEQEKFRLPIQNFKSGVYLVKGTTRDGLFVKKLVKY